MDFHSVLHCPQVFTDESLSCSVFLLERFYMMTTTHTKRMFFSLYEETLNLGVVNKVHTTTVSIFLRRITVSSCCNTTSNIFSKRVNIITIIILIITFIYIALVKT